MLDQRRTAHGRRGRTVRGEELKGARTDVRRGQNGIEDGPEGRRGGSAKRWRRGRGRRGEDLAERATGLGGDDGMARRDTGRSGSTDGCRDRQGSTVVAVSGMGPREQDGKHEQGRERRAEDAAANGGTFLSIEKHTVDFICAARFRQRASGPQRGRIRNHNNFDGRGRGRRNVRGSA